MPSSPISPQIKSLIKLVWHKCDARESMIYSNDCSLYATHEIVYVLKVQKQLDSSDILDLGITYTENDVKVRGKYCSHCVEVEYNFLKNLSLESSAEETVEIRKIKGVEEALKLIQE